MHDEREYEMHRQRILDYVVQNIHPNLVLFRQRNTSRGYDILTAAVQHPEDPLRFLVLGSFGQFPGWDSGSTPVDDWDTLLTQVDNWAGQMSRAAATAQMPPEVPVPSRPTFEDEPKVRWVWWISENGCFSNASRTMLMDPPVPIAPQSVIDQYTTLCQRAERERQLTVALKEELIAEAALHEAQDQLEKVRGDISDLRGKLY